MWKWVSNTNASGIAIKCMCSKNGKLNLLVTYKQFTNIMQNKENYFRKDTLLIGTITLISLHNHGIV